MNTKSVVAFVAGRSGGHILPALTLAHKAKQEQKTVLFFSTKHPLDQKIIKGSPAVNMHIPVSLIGFSLGNPFKLLLFIAQFIGACFKAWRTLRTHKVEEVVTTGGYISIPVCFAARMLKIPISLYELNVIPGRASYTIAAWATRVHICFTQTKSYFKNIICTKAEYPIRFNAQEKAITKEQAMAALSFSQIKKTIFIAGGSQGSVFVNTLIKSWLTLNPHVHSLVQIIHQTGAQDTTNWKAFYTEHEIPALVFDYKDSLAIEYAAADLIICRAGAGTLFEILFFNKPCLVIPLETRSTDHQKDNAAAMAAEHPELFSVLYEGQIKKNNTVLFSAINKHLYYKTTPVFKDKLVFE